MNPRTRECETACELARWASEEVAAGRPGAISTKANAADLVTETDQRIERRIRDTIAERFPGQVVVGEEYGGDPATDGAPTWYVDPIDGTTNYASGLPWCSISLALVDADGPAMGVVADPARGEVFSAVRGGPALCNGAPVRCREDATTMAGEVVVTEWAAYRPWPGMMAFLERLSDRMCTTRIMGSSALSLTSVAAGRAVGGVIGSYQPIDLLASVFIASRAGATVLAGDGTPSLFPSSGGICVAAPGLADELWHAWTDA